MWSSASAGRKRPPWLLRFRSSTAFIIATVWISSFAEYFLYAMIVPVMPTALVDRANIPYEDREYWVSVLLVCEAAMAFICCPIFGYIIDAAPTRQLPYLLGLVLLGASMGILAAAHTVKFFLIARILQGGATAMVAVAGLALLADSVTFDNLGQAIGYLGSAVALGFLLGPLLGGLVYDVAGYHAVFAMAFVIVGVDLVMRLSVIERKVAQRYLISEDGETPASSHQNQVSYQTFAEPAPPNPDNGNPRRPALLLIMQQPRVLISCWALLVQGLFYSAFDSVIPIFVETRFGWGPFGAGMAFLPSAITALFEPYFGSLSDRYGTRLITTTSFTLLTPPLIALRFVESNTTAHKALLLSLLTAAGLFMNASLPALFVETQQVLDEMEAARPGVFGAKGAVAQAFGLQTMAQFLGLFLGPMWGGFIDHRFGWPVMSLTLGVLAAGTAVPMFWLSGAPGGDRGEVGGEARREDAEGRGEGEREGLLRG